MYPHQPHAALGSVSFNPGFFFRVQFVFTSEELYTTGSQTQDNLISRWMLDQMSLETKDHAKLKRSWSSNPHYLTAGTSNHT